MTKDLCVCLLVVAGCSARRGLPGAAALHEDFLEAREVTDAWERLQLLQQHLHVSLQNHQVGIVTALATTPTRVTTKAPALTPPVTAEDGVVQPSVNLTPTPSTARSPMILRTILDLRKVQKKATVIKVEDRKRPRHDEQPRHDEKQPAAAAAVAALDKAKSCAKCAGTGHLGRHAEVEGGS